MSAGPLAGKRILVTRPEAQAKEFSNLIRQAGGEPLEVATIEIGEAADLAPLHSIADRLESFDLAIFVSRNAVSRAMVLLRTRRGGRPWPAHLRMATVGTGSREELERHGFSGVITPPARADSEALLALPELADVAGRRVAIFRGEGGRRLLGETLAARGATVEHAVCYRRRRPEAGGVSLREAWSKTDAVTVSSSEGLANLAAMLGAPRARETARTPLFVPHARVAEEAQRLGFGSAIVAGPGDREMVAALVAYFAGAR